MHDALLARQLLLLGGLGWTWNFADEYRGDADYSGTTLTWYKQYGTGKSYYPASCGFTAGYGITYAASSSYVDSSTLNCGFGTMYDTWSSTRARRRTRRSRSIPSPTRRRSIRACA